MRKKTLKGWEKSNVDMSEYLGLDPCEIDEALANDILETVASEFTHNTEYGYVGQGGEPEDKIDGIYYHMTVRMVGDKHYYLGILPSFNGAGRHETDISSAYRHHGHRYSKPINHPGGDTEGIMKTVQDISYIEYEETARFIHGEIGSCSAISHAVNDIILPDGRKAQIQITITTVEDDFM